MPANETSLNSGQCEHQGLDLLEAKSSLCLLLISGDLPKTDSN